MSFSLTVTQQRVLIGAVAAFLTTVTSILPIEDPLKVIIVGVIAAVAGYVMPKDA